MIVMNNLLEKTYNSYLHFLSLVNNGRTDQDYAIIYNALLVIKNNITDKKFIQYYESNLLEPIVYPLTFSN